MTNKIWNKFFMSFLNGVAVLLPITVTFILIRFLVLQVNNLILDPVMKALEPFKGGLEHVYIAKTIIFFIVILLVAIIGYGAKILVVNRFFSAGEGLLVKIPFLGKIYNAAKQIFSALIGQGKTIFKQVVLVEYPRKGLYSIGFTTGTSKGEIKDVMGRSAINIFIPTTPNPTSGIFLIVPRENVSVLKMTVEDGMKLVVSGGSVSPHYVVESGGEAPTEVL